MKTCVNKENPFLTLTRFQALRDLSVLDLDRVLPPNAFARWPQLERLELVGSRVTEDLEVVHGGLRSLIIEEHDECASVRLDCPFLEDLEIKSMEFYASWDEILVSSCPRLEKIHLVWDLHVMNKEEGGPFDFWDKAIKELVLKNLPRVEVSIACEKLERLVMTWAPFKEAPLRFPTTEHPNLTSLELDGYPFMFPHIPSLLSASPILEVLRIFGC